MRSPDRIRSALLVLALLAPLSCTPKSSPNKDHCFIDSDCNPGRACVNLRCQDVDAGSVSYPSSKTWVAPNELNRDVDILFMVDNSRSMLPLQDKLRASFSTFVQTLQALPSGQPNLHLAVVSSDMGAGASSIALCNNDQGIFKSSVGPSATDCTMTGLKPGERFISSVNGQNNFTGNIADVFSCIAAVGQDGCGFEAQLKSVVRALGADGNAPPTDNAGFLRPNAQLAIVLFTNEDDCSVTDNSYLFVSGVGHQFVSDPEGPLTSYRCNEFGHLCRGAPPPRTMAVTFDPGDCVPAEEQGLLIPVHTFVDQIKHLKTDPSQILVAAIGGLPDFYQVDQAPPLIAQDPAPSWPQIHHSCMLNSVEYADPGVRLAAFVNAFGANGRFEAICNSTFAPALGDIAQQIGAAMGPKCLDANLADGNTDTLEVDPLCQVADQIPNGAGGVTTSPIPPCSDNRDARPCWDIIPGTAAICPGSQHLAVTRSADPPTGTTTKITCDVCLPGVPNPGCF